MHADHLSSRMTAVKGGEHFLGEKLCNCQKEARAICQMLDLLPHDGSNKTFDWAFLQTPLL
jgi:hypothetical protein